MTPDDPQVTCDLPGLTSAPIPLEVVAAWTPEQRAEADAWAAREHTRASDHGDVERLPMPEHVRVCRG